ncbi:hypothetical protein V8E54_007392 [Elaphomyces granulatus]
MDRIEAFTGRSTLPLHAMSFPSPSPSLPDSSELPPRTPSSDLRLPSVSNGPTANTLRGERGMSEGQNSIRWTTSSATSKRPSNIELACPVFKSNPEGPHPKRCERGSWKMISRLKHEHLHRHHHIEASAITDEVLQRVYGKDSLTQEEKWGAIYAVLFPQARVIPCPYYGTDWPSGIEISGPSNARSSFPRPPGILHGDDPLPSTLDELDFYPALMTKVRCMLEEEEKHLRERIHAKLPEVVSETYWNLISTINDLD